MAEHDKSTRGSRGSRESQRRRSAARTERSARSHTREEKAAAKEQQRAQAELERLEAEAARAKARAEKEAERAERAERRRERWQKAWRRIRVVLIVLLVLLLAAAAGATAGGYAVSRSEKNLPKLFLDGIDVSGLTRAETMDKLAAAGWDENAEIPLVLELPADVRVELDMYKSGATLPREIAAEAAYRYGHAGNWYENLLRYLKALAVPTDVSQQFAPLDEDYIRKTVAAGVEAFQAATEDEGYVVDKEKEELRMMKGAGRMQLDEELLFQEVSAALKSAQKEVDHRHIDNTLTAPDFEALYTELHIKPVDAFFKEGGFEVEEEIVGCSFDTQQALSLWEAAGPAETVAIPLEISYPEVTAEKLRGMLYRDKLGSQTTLFGGSTPERVNNIQLACEKINGTVLMPGETFSYNGTVGERTIEAGFKTAAAYQDGEVVQETGGGVCQVSSTLYCAALFANMETVEREAHYFMVNYLPWAHDATVSWPKPDFKFRNSRNYPVKIVASADADEMTLTMEVWGTDEDGSYVELTYDRYYVTGEDGEEIIGWNVYGHRNIYDKDGNLIETVEEPDSTYYKHKEE